MSIFGAMRSGISGLFVQSQSMAMISDNIANVNTYGYKTNKAQFSTLVTSQSSPSTYSSGGVQSNIRRNIDEQGLLTASSSSTDIAIDGPGFFAVTDGLSQNTTTGEWEVTGNVYFTRAGEFRPDKDGNLVNAAGYYLTGWKSSGANTFAQTNVFSAFSGINLADQSASPVATDAVTVDANLNSQAATGATFDVPMQIFDKQGTRRTLTITYTKAAAANTWTMAGTVSGGSWLDIDANNDGTTGDNALISGTTSVGLGTVTFNPNGTLASITPSTAAGDITTVNANNQLVFSIDYDDTLATTNDRVQLTVDMGTVNSGNGIVQYDGPSTINDLTQNGKQFGSLTGVSINEYGVFTALFDNGETRELYQVPTVTFNNPNGLQPKTGNVYQQTDYSGLPIAHVPGTGGAGSVSGSSLEASTVDLATEFTDMIVTQRAYSASTKIITTADEMLDELIRAKR